ncbi:MAG: transporter substrate-binding domain-containing protein [Fibromonadales bacterium]|nr:transporter substrate-binding domain-containing protein [Fibromonadales bacterium]
MRICAFVLAIMFTASFLHGRNLASIRKDAFTVGVSKSDSAAEYDFIAEISAKMKIPRFRLVVFENANAAQKLLLDGKIDAIISKINHSPRLENSFLVSAPYAKTEIAVATLAQNSEIWTLADLNGKNIAFITKEVSSEQIQSYWPNSKPIAAQTQSDAIKFLQKNEASAIIAAKETLKDPKLKIFPNNLAENNIVALFSPNSQTLQQEFNKALKVENEELRVDNKDRIDKILMLLNELQKEIKELK